MAGLQRKSKGDPLSISAADWNAIIAMVRKYRSEGDFTGGGRHESKVYPANTVLIKNTLGTSAGSRTVYRLGDTVIDPGDSPLAFNRRPAFEGLEPDDAGNAFAVSFGPAGDGDFVRAAILGVCSAEVEVVGLDDRYAAPTPGDATRLTSAVKGPARILSPVTEVGVQTLAVMLCCCGEYEEGGSGGQGSSGSPGGTGSPVPPPPVILPACSDLGMVDLAMAVETLEGAGCGIDGDYTLDLNVGSTPGHQIWNATMTGSPFSVVFQCIANVLYFSDGTGGANPTPVAANDDPILLVYEITIGGAGPCAGRLVRFTITSLP